MYASINRVILLGTIAQNGVEMRFTERGTAHATFTLVLTELGQDGREHATWIACECWGKGAEKAGELEPGQCVLFEGKLRRYKRGEQWDTTVSGFEVNPVVQASTPATQGERRHAHSDRKERLMPMPTALTQVLPGMLPASSYSLEQLEHLATVCYKSGLFEDVTDAAQAFMKILKGTEMGLPVTTSMQAFDIIKKRLFIKPFAIAALINSCGYGSYHVREQTAEVCTIHFARKYPGQGWLECPPVSYTIQEARAHGLVDRSPHWKASPAHMLYQRCMGRGGAMYFPELLAGLQPPQDDTPIAPEQHAQNVYDVFGVEPEPGAPALPAPGQADRPEGDEER